MKATRTPFSPLTATVVLLVLVGVMGCGGSRGTGSVGQYPLVEASSPAKPSDYEAEPSPSCEREIATFHDGSEPTRRPIVIPPAPGLRATAVTQHRTRLEWSFRDLPDDCRPVELALSVVASGRSTPTTKRVAVTTATGGMELEYPDFLPVPDVALASAYSAEGHRSRTVSVLIRRAANTPPDPPDPAPPVSAPAGDPVTCEGHATAFDDPAGDVLIYAPGSPPSRVADMSPKLSGIDITRASVQIDDRTMCATFVFAESPTSADFQVTLTLRDITTPACCASLRFRRTAGRLEVGHFTVDANGAYQLEPVTNAGALLRDNTLLMTGTLPPPKAWQLQSHRMPSAADLGWSVTSTHHPDKYGASYGDWLPGYEAAGEPVVRHRDGATLKPGSAG